MKTILVPVDFSSITDRVITEAVDLALPADARIVLFHVTEPLLGLVDYSVVAMTIANASEAEVKAAQERLRTLQEHWQTRYFRVETAHAIGSPIDEIIEAVSRVPADYIVMGSHGHGKIYDVFMGSTTHGVLKRAPCPVLIIPASMPRRGPAVATAKEATT